jgi:DNA polymerase (family 10)
MQNKHIADIFDNISDILEFKQDNPFKIRAYRKASQVLSSMSEDISTYAEKDTLTSLDGIGKELSEKIKEIIKTGHLETYERLRKEVPEGILDIMSISGIGPRTAKLFYDKLKIDSVEKLKQKAQKGELSRLPSIKEKTEQNILKAINFIEGSSERMLLGEALPIADEIVERLKGFKQVEKISLAGSLRRMKETIGDIDILVSSKKPACVMDHFIKTGGTKKVMAHGDTKSSIMTEEGIQVDLRVVEPGSYGAALVYFTGSKAHNINIRRLAVKKKLKINEYGVFYVKNNRKKAGSREKDVYRSIGLDMIPPELREDTGEVNAARSHKLPSLIEFKDIKGDLHVHSNLSDGDYTIEELADIYKDRGYSYIASTDHSQSLKVAGGLSEKQLLSKTEDIRKLNKRFKGFRILAAAEVDIKSDGKLDYPDELLKELDIVIAAIHSGFKQQRKQITERILKAMDNRHVNILAHPTGRLIGRREAYDVDLEKVITHAKDTNVAIEINSYPERLDLDDIHTKRAVETGAKLVVSTDFHSKEQMDFMRLGVAVARRGWAQKKDVLNTLTAEKLLKYIRR